MIDREALEARLARVLRRYLAPELASRAAAEAVREPEAPPLQGSWWVLAVTCVVIAALGIAKGVLLRSIRCEARPEEAKG